MQKAELPALNENEKVTNVVHAQMLYAHEHQPAK